MLTIFLICLASSCYYYVEAIKSGLSAKQWAVVGLIFGPLVWPMFTISRHMRFRRDCGFNNAYLQA
ncbi:hypothetical protein [Alteromonas gilva]|uniref:Uncharacterized protein n=1 Tax=Alteromonas gilva TaxID=2987522 RepID=A0ABT5L3F0_9ALTE|nr:hypothetical protein [Alteromonas gilva]MDC8831575.1 hypothetical protein [Alteromonas gilva]